MPLRKPGFGNRRGKPPRVLAKGMSGVWPRNSEISERLPDLVEEDEEWRAGESIVAPRDELEGTSVPETTAACYSKGPATDVSGAADIFPDMDQSFIVSNKATVDEEEKEEIRPGDGNAVVGPPTVEGRTILADPGTSPPLPPVSFVLMSGGDGSAATTTRDYATSTKKKGRGGNSWSASDSAVLIGGDLHGILSEKRWKRRKRKASAHGGEKNKKDGRKSYMGKGKVINREHELYTLSIAVMLGLRTSIGMTNGQLGGGKGTGGGVNVAASSNTAAPTSPTTAGDDTKENNHGRLWLSSDDFMTVEKYVRWL